MSPIIRAAAADDVEHIAHLETICFPDPWSRASISRILETPSSAICVAEKEPQGILGYAITTSVSGEGELERIGVAPACRRTGVGRSLLRYALGQLVQAGVKVVWLEVRRSNESALRLYEREGFELVRVRKGYYPPREDALIMRKLLVPEPAG
ncbi:MAG TPA: ribosomal protein S18-alanine N-acetyltransferase [Candidatus Latescibacteria bacterium]|nr:ribosomal protein S18-alanine N-acetyltransferase [Candidatus Latescibacterota bacterium]HOS64984.1 ribosomal protein S18-alanine N-acetyltransferase [Candidatus Latescibacterota bacterium]HPK74158.1 ribosomal protein S18-alanine N-acetyltransferase [Candidatus Latescibacterota bacterium]